MVEYNIPPIVPTARTQVNHLHRKKKKTFTKTENHMSTHNTWF